MHCALFPTIYLIFFYLANVGVCALLWRSPHIIIMHVLYIAVGLNKLRKFSVSRLLSHILIWPNFKLNCLVYSKTCVGLGLGWFTNTRLCPQFSGFVWLEVKTLEEVLWHETVPEHDGATLLEVRRENFILTLNILFSYWSYSQNVSSSYLTSIPPIMMIPPPCLTVLVFLSRRTFFIATKQLNPLINSLFKC